MTIDEAYLILGIEDRNIDEDELRRIFYHAAHLSHPDSNPENQYAKSKFAMIQEAYNVLKGNVRPTGIKTNSNTNTSTDSNTNSYTKSKTNKKSEKDRWDYYNEADRKYRQMRREETRRKAEHAFRQQKEAEHRFTAQRASFSKPEMTNSAQASVKVEHRYNKNIILEKAVNYFRLFLEKDMLFDSILIFCIGLMMVIELFEQHFRDFGLMTAVVALLSWTISILGARKVTKILSGFTKTAFVSILIFLIILEAFVELFKLFLF